MAQYGYTYKNGGLLEYDGVSCDGKTLSGISVDCDSSSVAAIYSDGDVYTVSADIIRSGNTCEVVNASATWAHSGNVSAAPAKYSMIAMLLNSGSGSSRPDELIYTDSDQSYTPPVTPAAGETFDTVTEVYGNVRSVFGIGVTGKGTSGETVTRIIYPDGEQTVLTGW